MSLEGVPTLVLEKLLDAERAKQASMPTDDRSKGVLRIPQNLSAPMLEGDAQRNVPGILAMIQEEAEMKAEMKAEKVSMRQGQGLSLPLSKGIMTAPMSEIMSFKSVFDPQ